MRGETAGARTEVAPAEPRWLSPPRCKASRRETAECCRKPLPFTNLLAGHIEAPPLQTSSNGCMLLQCLLMLLFCLLNGRDRDAGGTIPDLVRHCCCGALYAVDDEMAVIVVLLLLEVNNA